MRIGKFYLEVFGSHHEYTIYGPMTSAVADCLVDELLNEDPKWVEDEYDPYVYRMVGDYEGTQHTWLEANIKTLNELQGKGY